MQLLTYGHGTSTQGEIVDLLNEAGVRLLVDVRTAPGSRRLPHVMRAELEQWLPAAGIGYRWEPDLGGFRKATPDSPDVAWRNASFRGYAGYARTPRFAAALDRLLEDAGRETTTVMCSETLWWRCHRRIIADYAVLSRGFDVRHLMHDGKLAQHVVTEGARLRDDGLLVYDEGALA